jgi:hypothetical protein
MGNQMKKRRRQNNQPVGFISGFRPRVRRAVAWTWEWAWGEGEDWLGRWVERVGIALAFFFIGMTVQVIWGKPRTITMTFTRDATLTIEQPKAEK